MRYQFTGAYRARSARASLVAGALGAAMVLAGCAATQDAAAPESAAKSKPSASVSVVGDTRGAVQPIASSCEDGHLSLHVYNQTGNTLTLSTTQPPSEDDGGIYIDDDMATCTWDDTIAPWSDQGAWMLVNTTKVDGDGEMSSEIYWNLDDEGDVLHAHGWADYEDQDNTYGDDETAGSCEVTGPNAADFNCHDHNEFRTGWDRGFTHFTLTCTNPNVESACKIYSLVDNPMPTISFDSPTLESVWAEAPGGSPSQPWQNVSGLVEVSYVFPSDAKEHDGYQVTFASDTAITGDEDGLFSLSGPGGDSCSGQTYVAVYDGSSTKWPLCHVAVNSAGAGETVTLVMGVEGAVDGQPYGPAQGEEAQVVGTVVNLPVAAPTAPTNLTVTSGACICATARWDAQSPLNAPLSSVTMTLTPTTGGYTADPSATTVTHTYYGTVDPMFTFEGDGLVLGQEYDVSLTVANFVGSATSTSTVEVGKGSDDAQSAPARTDKGTSASTDSATSSAAPSASTGSATSTSTPSAPAAPTTSAGAPSATGSPAAS